MKNAIVNKVISKVGPKAGRLVLFSKAHAPEAMVIGGIACGVACVVMACKGTLKVEKILDEHAEEIKAIKNTEVDTSEKDTKKKVVKLYAKTSGKLLKLYWPSAVLGCASCVLLIGSHGIMEKRVASLSAALTASDETFKAYRARAVEKYGEEADRELRYGTKEVEREVKTTNEDGSESTETVKKTIPERNPNDKFLFWFNRGCLGAWEPDINYNRAYVENMRTILSRTLNYGKGYVFVNDVLDAFNIDRIPDGQLYGWIKNRDETGLVNINIVGEDDEDLLLEFVVDGYILDKI